MGARREFIGEQAALKGKRILVVDDNATNRRILALQTAKWGMVVQDTEFPARALEMLKKQAYDLAIVDMHMPQMDGAMLAKEIKEAGFKLPLVLFSSLGRKEADDGPFAATLAKPLRQSQLFDTLVSLLSHEAAPRPAAAPVKPRMDPEMAKRHPLRILLAEDNVVNQKLAMRLLLQMGYRADLASNGLEAIESVERQTYDVILMDVQMPEMDGLEASRRISQRWPADRRPRIVAMTANAMQGDREECLAAGMDDYVTKPIRVDQLVEALINAKTRKEIFGAPQALEDAPLAAARAAIDMMEMIELFNVERVALGKEPIRIGIASGEVVAGYTGTQQRATYTCIGDTVNLAARLEAHTKEARRGILIDGETQTALADRVPMDTLGEVLFKGKSAAVPVFAINLPGQG